MTEPSQTATEVATAVAEHPDQPTPAGFGDSPVVEGSVADLEGSSSAGTFSPSAGDFALVDGAVALIEFFDAGMNLMTFVTAVNNSVNRTTNHISTTQVRELDQDAHADAIAQLKTNQSLSTSNISEGTQQEDITAGASRVSGAQGNDFIGLDQKPTLEAQEQLRADALAVPASGRVAQEGSTVDDHQPASENVGLTVDPVADSKDEHDLGSDQVSSK